MFESPVEKQPSSNKGVWIGVAIVAVLVVVGGGLYLQFGGGGKASTETAPARVAPAPGQKADPVRDLRVVSTKMDKDPTGTTALWLVELKNQSQVYTYSQISYETTYARADNSILAQNRGTVTVTIAPGEDQNAQIRDVLYPSGTAWYRFRVLDATASTQ